MNQISEKSLPPKFKAPSAEVLSTWFQGDPCSETLEQGIRDIAVRIFERREAYIHFLYGPLELRFVDEQIWETFKGELTKNSKVLSDNELMEILEKIKKALISRCLLQAQQPMSRVP